MGQTDGSCGEVENLRRALAERERQLDAVRHIAASLCAATKLDDLLRRALDACMEVAEAEGGSIVLTDPETKQIEFEYAVGDYECEATGTVQDFRDHADPREANGRLEHVSTNLVTAPLRSGSGDIIGRMQVVNKRGAPFDAGDVAVIEIMAAQVELAIENERLHEEARLAEVVQFIGDISHDVKNMVTPAMTGAETLRLVANDCFTTFDHHVHELVNDGIHREQIIGPLADLRALYPELTEMIGASCGAVQERMAEIAAAVKGIISEPTFEPADVVAIANRVRTMLETHAQRKGVALAVQAEGKVPPATVDAKQVYNAIYNLVFNAIDACDEGQMVEFRVWGLVDGDFPDGNQIVLECRDNGLGMPEEIKSKLFTSQAVSTKPMGTGLGTRIVKNVIDAHGGLIELESELGVGTIVRCRVPASRA